MYRQPNLWTKKTDIWTYIKMERRLKLWTKNTDLWTIILSKWTNTQFCGPNDGHEDNRIDHYTLRYECDKEKSEYFSL